MSPLILEQEPALVDKYWQLCLYVAGQTGRSLSAIDNLQYLCAAHLEKSQYQIEVIDLLVHPELACADNIIAIPTLIRRQPLPMCKIIGDLSNTDKTLAGLKIKLTKNH